MTNSFKPDYKKYYSNRFCNLEDVSKLKNVLLSPDTGIIALIRAAVVTLGMGILYWIYKSIIDEQMLIDKQNYEASQNIISDNDVNIL